MATPNNKPKVTVRQREKLWYQEDDEESPADYARRLREEDRTRAQKQKQTPNGKKLNEKYDGDRFQPGWNGKDAPAVEKMGSGYAKNGDGTQDYDDLGASSGKKTSKGSVGKVTVDDIKEGLRLLAKQRAKALSEELLDDEFADDEMESEGGEAPGGDGFGEEQFGGDEGLGGESDVPPEMEDEGFEGEDDAMADDVKVEIGGQRFSLVPDEEDEFGGEMGDEFGAGEEGGDAGFDEEPLEGDEGFSDEETFGDEAGTDGGLNTPDDRDEELIRHGGVKAEKKDLTVEKGKKRVKEDKYDLMLDEAIAKARGAKPAKKKITKEELIKHHLRIKNMLEKNHKISVKKLHELFTGEYVLNKQGEPGYDFSPVGGDEKFAVVARAASGDQYTPTVSKSVWEPEKKGGKTAHATTVTEDFKQWMAKYQKSLSESDDPGKDSDNFNKNDMLDKNLPPGGAEEFPQLPEILGKDADTISQYGEAQKRVEARRTQEDLRRKKEKEEKVRFPSEAVQEDLETNLKESFDFRRALRGEY